MDNLRSTMEGSRGSFSAPASSANATQEAASDGERVLREIEALDEQTRAKLLQRISQRVEEEKLR